MMSVPPRHRCTGAGPAIEDRNSMAAPAPQMPNLTVRSIGAIGVEVPMTYALGTSRGRITKAPLVLIDVQPAQGIPGRAYLGSYSRQAMPAIASILRAIEEPTAGQRVEPKTLWAML